MKGVFCNILFGLLSVVLGVSCAVPTDQASREGHGGGHGDGHMGYKRSSSFLRAEGARQFEKIKRTKRVSTNPAHRAQLQRVGSKLARVVPSSGKEWEFVVFENDRPNAFAMPGDKVGVNSGMFRLTRNDAGLAAVLGHEMAHVTRAHAQTRLRFERSIGIYGGRHDSVSSASGECMGAGETGSTVAKLEVARAHSRAREFEADRIGMNYMAQAGYDPRGAIKFWRRFAAHTRNWGKGTPQSLHTHPKGSMRITALEKYLPAAMDEYRK